VSEGEPVGAVGATVGTIVGELMGELAPPPNTNVSCSDEPCEIV